jgi:SAM-dependent methyltransferase
VSTNHELTLTGERTLPGIAVENYWFRRHEAAYELIEPWCRDEIVLEAGAGEGYGAAALARSARQVIGVDYDVPATVHAGATYPELAVLRANLVALPLQRSTVDTVVSLQVIEHMWDQLAYLLEMYRVLRPAGRVILSTPNRLTFSPNGTTNPYHTRELDPAEFVELLEAAGFAVTQQYGLRHGRRLRKLDKRYGGSFVNAQLAGPAATWDAALRNDVASVTTADFAFETEELDTSLDLLLVAVKE